MLENSPLELPDYTVTVPREVLQDLGDLHGVSREEVLEVLEKGPLSIGRGSPPKSLENSDLLNLVKHRFLDRFPVGFPTYKGRSHPEAPEANAFRGDLEYLDLARTILKEEWGLDADIDQLFSGNGGQALVTALMEAVHSDAFASTELTFDRTKRNMEKISRRTGFSIPQNAEGLDMNRVKEFFNWHEDGTLFLVSTGNPDGVTLSVEQLKDVCELATHYGNGQVILDASYIRLYFDESSKESLAPLQPYLNSCLSVVFSHTKEGGQRGAAFAVGPKYLIARALAGLNDRDLSPVYQLQVEHTMMEQAQNLPEGVLGFQEFLAERLRPRIKASWESVEKGFAESDLLQLSADVTHGYNVAVHLNDRVERDAFFKVMAEMGVQSGDLSNFLISNNRTLGERGFRLPFGALSPVQSAFVTAVAKDAAKRSLL